jgi:hypothetical protein
MAIVADRRSTDSTELRLSRYVQGGLTNIFNTRLGWWERRKLDKAVDDIQYKIDDNEAGRPDLIAYNAYGRVSLAWLVMQYNTIVDPVTELVSGVILLLPSEQRVMTSILTLPVGGNKIRYRKGK